MSAASPVSSFEFPLFSHEPELRPEQVPRFTFQVSRGGALREPAMELPQVVPASTLADRPAAATVLSGIEQLDALTGGLPRGGLTEICGPASSGRTSVLLALMAAMTARGEVCALVDASDSFDPISANAAEVELRRLLWVRCAKTSTVNGRRSAASSELRVASCERKAKSKSQMDSLEQALKATDLLLQGGGFGLVVVDLGDVPAQAARRVPLTSWFRFRRAVENTPTVLVVVEQEPYAKTCASVVLRLAAVSSQLSAGVQDTSVPENQETAHGRILGGLDITAEVVRSAVQGKKPVRSAGAKFASRAQWVKGQSQIG